MMPPVTPPNSMNGLRTRSRSDNTPMRITEPAFIAHSQFARLLASFTLKVKAVVM